MKILETVLYAEDLPAAERFYTGVLGLEPISIDLDRHMFLRLEGSVLIVFRPSKTLVPDAGVPPHGTTGPGHAAFSVTEEELEGWRARLAAADVPIIDEIHWPNGGHSIYFHDPAGNVLEFATPQLWGL